MGICRLIDRRRLVWLMQWGISTDVIAVCILGLVIMDVALFVAVLLLMCFDLRVVLSDLV